MATVDFDESDTGKTVVDAEGDEIGVITEVRGDRAYVDPDPSMMENVKSRLGWGDSDDDAYPLKAEHVQKVTDNQVRLNRL